MIITAYVIVPVEDITQDILDVVVETSLDTVRKNNAGILSVLKYQGDKPSILNPYDDYTHEEILVEMAKPEWNKPFPPKP